MSVRYQLRHYIYFVDSPWNWQYTTKAYFNHNRFIVTFYSVYHYNHVLDYGMKFTFRSIRLQSQQWLASFSSKFWWKVYHLVRKKIKKKDWKKSQVRSKSLEQFMFYSWWLCSGVDSILRHHSQIHLESKEFQHLLDPYSLLFQEKINYCIYVAHFGVWFQSDVG